VSNSQPQPRQLLRAPNRMFNLSAFATKSHSHPIRDSQFDDHQDKRQSEQCALQTRRSGAALPTALEQIDVLDDLPNGGVATFEKANCPVRQAARITLFRINVRSEPVF